MVKKKKLTDLPELACWYKKQISHSTQISMYFGYYSKICVQILHKYICIRTEYYTEICVSILHRYIYVKTEYCTEVCARVSHIYENVFLK